MASGHWSNLAVNAGAGECGVDYHQTFPFNNVDDTFGRLAGRPVRVRMTKLACFSCFWGGVKNGHFWPNLAKNRLQAKFAESQKPANLYSTKWRFLGHFLGPPPGGSQRWLSPRPGLLAVYGDTCDFAKNVGTRILPKSYRHRYPYNPRAPTCCACTPTGFIKPLAV